ncbi:MAG: oxidoreductase [Labilithrix sp.]|nr:oxidoreductase [Labilithrix sp.]
MRSNLALAATIAATLIACSQGSSDPTLTDPAKKTASAALAEAPTPDTNCGPCGDKDTVEDSPRTETINLGSSPTRGPDAAPVTIVVFSDFECSYCAKSEATLRELEATYGAKVRFVFKNAPLPMHAHARLAAKAALAAGQQGKFWPYHDALFAAQGSLDQAGLEQTAARVGLDVAKFRRALASQELDAALEADLAEARRLDVKGTPAFFINGKNLQGAQPASAFKARIDQALAER